MSSSGINSSRNVWHFTLNESASMSLSNPCVRLSSSRRERWDISLWTNLALVSLSNPFVRFWWSFRGRCAHHVPGGNGGQAPTRWHAGERALYVCIYVYVYMYMYIYIYIYMQATVRGYMQSARRHAGKRALYVCIYVYVYIYICMNIYIYMYAGKRAWVYAACATACR